ncbi:hypothetical protein [Streptomyces scabiei]|uniref:hypothetical protein n=1 Tax=Streptomyces scabiei TaxID=1930 RepID=UPI0038F69697
MKDRRTSTPIRAPHLGDNVTGVSTITDQIGPRRPGVVYYDGPRLVQVAEVITDVSESQRILKRRAARFAIRLVDQHAGTEYYTGAIWTGSDRVLKAVAA